jgi:hypothetical protein
MQALNVALINQQAVCGIKACKRLPVNNLITVTLNKLSELSELSELNKLSVNHPDSLI